ncbi:flavodoxin [Cellulosilyticum sp. I15G10I2]|uniref:flavodoxin n=1 Tax=Cellulosilyticum sp. I15G10I2 TaxID=1892843 RepID=UPI00085CCE10|nr:flavodoxin [Cellulosilyticum sp. I15G10I2]
MKNMTIIYWSATGNTEAMALALEEGAKKAGVSVKLLEVGNASKEEVLKADAVALGCPSMGAEELEEEEMEPFIASLEVENLKGKPMLLFGSYDWGDGQWMREWTERMTKLGVLLMEDGLIIQNTPDEDGLNKCREIGEKFASI